MTDGAPKGTRLAPALEDRVGKVAESRFGMLAARKMGESAAGQMAPESWTLLIGDRSWYCST